MHINYQIISRHGFLKLHPLLYHFNSPLFGIYDMQIVYSWIEFHDFRTMFGNDHIDSSIGESLSQRAYEWREQDDIAQGCQSYDAN